MKNYMFQSKGGALIFVVLTLVSVAALVGTEDEDGALVSAAAQLEQQGDELNGVAETMANPDPDPEPMVVEVEDEGSFASDEDLILDPTGIEPVGLEPNPEANEAEEVVLVEPTGESATE